MCPPYDLHIGPTSCAAYPGHWFQMVGAGSARKDTLNVLSVTAAEFDIEADNPGQWMLHCHNTYHLETGMATVFSYRD